MLLTGIQRADKVGETTEGKLSVSQCRAILISTDSRAFWLLSGVDLKSRGDAIRYEGSRCRGDVSKEVERCRRCSRDKITATPSSWH